MLLSFLLLVIPQLWAVDIKLESSLNDNPDKTFVSASRSSIVFGPFIEHKFKGKRDGTFFLVRSRIDYKHDLEAQRLREGEVSSTILGIRPMKEFLVGASFSAGHLWRWRRDYNVNTNKFQGIDGDHFFVETRVFSEKKISKKFTGELSLAGRMEDYASAYSIYVNQQNDNLGASLVSSLTYKNPFLEVKPLLSYSRKWWRERRALSKDGFFVSPGEELKPDRIDTMMASVKNSIKLRRIEVVIGPSWNRVSDLNNDGRSWTGPGLSGELNFPVSSFNTQIKSDWSKREYETQLATFQSDGQNKLVEETFAVTAAVTAKLGPWVIEFDHRIERSTSNQIDSQARKIGLIESATTGVSVSTTF